MKQFRFERALLIAQNNINTLPTLDDTRYENIFKLAKDDKFFFYNIIKKISIPDDIQSEVYIEIRVNSKQPWTTLSNTIYGNQNLWWLICLVNKIYNMGVARSVHIGGM